MINADLNTITKTDVEAIVAAMNCSKHSAKILQILYAIILYILQVLCANKSMFRKFYAPKMFAVFEKIFRECLPLAACCRFLWFYRLMFLSDEQNVRFTTISSSITALWRILHYLT